MNVPKAGLEGIFVDELRRLQPTPGYMRLVNDRILSMWQQLRGEVRERAADAERRVTAVQVKLDRLDDAFLFAKSIDQTTYERQRDKVRQELAWSQIERHAEQLEEFGVEGLLAFAERIFPRAADMWVQPSLDQKQRLQALFFPEGIAFDGNRFDGTAVTAPVFSYLRSENDVANDVVSLTFASWNQTGEWLRRLDALRCVA